MSLFTAQSLNTALPDTSGASASSAVNSLLQIPFSSNTNPAFKWPRLNMNTLIARALILAALLLPARLLPAQNILQAMFTSGYEDAVL